MFVIIRVPFLIYVRLLLFSVYITHAAHSAPAIINIYFMHVYTNPSISLYIMYHVRENDAKIPILSLSYNVSV